MTSKLCKWLCAFILLSAVVPVLAGPTNQNNPNANAKSDPHDGCGCGSSAPNSKQADQHKPQAPSAGMPTYSFLSMLAGLSLTDTPITYTPPVGPDMAATLTYNAREANQSAVFDAVNLGHKWTLNWISYIQDDPAHPGKKVMRYLPGGGGRSYFDYPAATGKFAPQENNAAVLVRVSSDPIEYDLLFNDGSKAIFTASDDTASYPRKVYLTKKVDPHGNAVTLHYDDSLRLTSVTDAIGQSVTFQYDNTSYPLAVTGITDPFGRHVAIGYDRHGRLNAITDVMGMTSTFTYNSQENGYFINSMTTPYGTTTFKQTKGVGSSTELSVQATDPLGYTSRTEFRHNAPGISYAAPVAPSGMGVRNQYLNYRNSFYWDKTAYARACTQAGDGSTKHCDYTKARIRHYLHNSRSKVGAETARVIQSVKYPLENRVWYRYPGQHSVLYTGSLDKPIYIGRVLSDGSTQKTRFAYNKKGKLTRIIDPAGRETRYTYAANGIDLIKVEQKTAAGFKTTASYTWNHQHEPLTATNAAGQTTTYTYNARGQRTSTTNALGQTTSYTYNAEGYLTTVTNALGHVQKRLTYDAVGRVASVTDSEGYTVTYQYDALNRVTAITYPDGTRNAFTWNKLDLVAVTDREGHTTRYQYDANRNLITKTDAMGHITRYSYYPNGKLKTLTDSNGNTTTWVRDLEGRVTKKVYADGNGTTFTYDATNQLISKTDALGQTTHYTYSVDGRLIDTRYTNAINPTPSVTFAYGTYFPRLIKMIDGHGTTNYRYYPPGVLGADRLQRVQGPDSHDSLEYTWDKLNRLATRTVDGDTEAFTYDALGRLTGDNNALGDFTNRYLGDTTQLTSRKAAGVPFQVVRHYENNLNSRHLKALLNETVTQQTPSRPWPFNTPAWGWLPQLPSHTVITPVTDYQFTSNADGLFTSRAVTGLPDSTNHHDLSHGHHHDWNQVFHWGMFGGLLGNNNKSQDDHHGHNQSNHQNTVTRYTYDADHRLLSALSNSNRQGRHQHHQAPWSWSWWHQSWAHSNAEPSASGDNFTYAYDPAGNLLSLTIGNKTTTLTPNALNQIAQKGTSAYQYDANGNLVNDGINTYRWDAANRLLSVTNQSTGQVVSFTYDGLGRRISKTVTPQHGSATTTKNLWCGLTLCEQRHANGTVLARYFSQGEVKNGTVYFYVADQIGSVVAMIKKDGTVAGRTRYGPYGQIISQSGNQPGFAYARLYHDTASGLELATFRAYDPQTGHWLKRDPIREAGGVNLYAYVMGSPINTDDKLGFWQVTVTVGAGYAARATVGYNSGQWNAGGYFGAGEGVSVDVDPTNTGRKSPGAGLQSVGEGEVGLGPNVHAAPV